MVYHIWNINIYIYIIYIYIYIYIYIKISQGYPIFFLKKQYYPTLSGIITAGWWFGTWILLFHSVGNNMIPTDFHIFQRGWNHQPYIYMYIYTLMNHRKNGTVSQYDSLSIWLIINITEYSEHCLKIWYTLVHNVTQYYDIYSNVFFHEIYNWFNN